MSENEPKPKPWFKITCFGCFLAPCLFGLGSLSYVKYRVSQKANELPNELAKLRQLGVPTEPADLVRNPPIPDDQNAAPLYKDAIAQIEALKKTKEDPAVESALNDRIRYLDDLDLIRKGLAHREDILATVEKAASRPFCEFPRDYSQGANLLFPEYASMKWIARWFNHRATIKAKAGDLDGALGDIRTIFAISGHLAQEPPIIGALVSIAVDTTGLAALEQVATLGQNDPAFLAKAREILETLPPFVDPKRNFGGEVVLGRYSIRNLRNIQKFTSAYYGGRHYPPRPSLVDTVTIGDPQVRYMFEAKFLHQWRRIFERLPPDADDWQAQNKVFEPLERQILEDRSFDNILNQVLFPALSEFGQIRASGLAKRRVALVAIRLLQDRRQGLPQDLKAYGKIAIDPMDGLPLRYQRKNDQAFKVWSIDANMVDDGGAKYIPQTNTLMNQTDYVWGFGVTFSSPPSPKDYRSRRAQLPPSKRQPGKNP